LPGSVKQIKYILKLGKFNDMDDISPSDSTEALIPPPGPVDSQLHSRSEILYVAIITPLAGVFALTGLAIFIFSSVGSSQ
jgi:hypothetical protein